MNIKNNFIPYSHQFKKVNFIKIYFILSLFFISHSVWSQTPCVNFYGKNNSNLSIEEQSNIITYLFNLPISQQSKIILEEVSTRTSLDETSKNHAVFELLKDPSIVILEGQGVVKLIELLRTPSKNSEVKQGLLNFLNILENQKK